MSRAKQSKRPPVEILHSFDTSGGYWVQVRFHRQSEPEALAAVRRRVLSAGWDPEGEQRFENTSESRNWLTREYWFREPLSIARMLETSGEELETEQALLHNDAEHVHRMRDRRAAFNAERNPLFAAAGALDEVCPEPSYLGFAYDRYEAENSGQVQLAAGFQEAARRRRQVERILGAEAVLELDDHMARVYPPGSESLGLLLGRCAPGAGEATGGGA